MRSFERPLVEPKPSFSRDLPETSKEFLSGYPIEPYWVGYEVPELNSLIQTALSQNFSLQEAFYRIEQARGQAQYSGAERFPDIEANVSARRSRVETQQALFSGGFVPVSSVIQSQFAVLPTLSYEVDIFDRIKNTYEAAVTRVKATEADFQGTYLSLSGEVFRQWMAALTARREREVVQEQLRVSETFLELIELRFSTGRSSALDVLEQRQQVALLRTELPSIELQYEQALNALSVLLGQSPGSLSSIDIGSQFPSLMESPPKIRPVDLITLRPDLRAVLFRLKADEYDVAVAVAFRYPRLSLGLNYSLTSGDIENLFPNKVLTGLSNLFIPLIDSGLQKGFLKMERSEVERNLSLFSETFLQAIREVEDSLAAEEHQKNRLEMTQERQRVSHHQYEEARNRYLNGLSDFLPVLIALQAKQQVERQIVREEAQRILVRNQLLLATGGMVPVESPSIEDSLPSGEVVSEGMLLTSTVMTGMREGTDYDIQ
jgi:NodT family efflux transporter outer membrane factor (OMF) lipoprotein